MEPGWRVDELYEGEYKASITAAEYLIDELMFPMDEWGRHDVRLLESWSDVEVDQIPLEV